MSDEQRGADFGTNWTAECALADCNHPLSPRVTPRPAWSPDLPHRAGLGAAQD